MKLHPSVLFLPVSLLALTLAACAGVPPRFPPLAGQWMPQSAELGGRDLPLSSFAGATLNLTTDSYEFGGDQGTYTIAEWSSSGEMDIHGVSGPNAGRTIPAIYELDGDELKLCYQLGSGERPDGFDSPEGSQVLLVRYRRAL